MDEKAPARERFLEASAGLFRRQGAAATGLKEVVRESGAPWGSLYHYFPEGKEQLVAEALLRTGERYSERLRTVGAEVFAAWQQVVADAFTESGIPKKRALDLANQFLVGLEGALILSRARRDEAVLRRAGEVIAAAVNAEHPPHRRRSRSASSTASQET